MKNRAAVVVRKIGNSCIISVPKWILKELGWKEGDLIQLKHSQKDSSLLAKKVI